MTLVNLGPKLDQAVMVLGKLNHMSYAATVRMLVILGVRALIKSGTFQGWSLPEDFEKILDGQPVKLTVTRAPREVSASESTEG